MILTVENSEIERLFDVKNGQGLRHFVKKAEPKAQKILAHGEIVRRKHDNGNVNSSVESTPQGTLEALDDIAPAAEPLFGNRFRQAVRTLRNYWKK